MTACRGESVAAGYLLLWARVQQNAPMVPRRTMKATKAPTATPMMTATGTDAVVQTEEKYPYPSMTQHADPNTLSHSNVFQHDERQQITQRYINNMDIYMYRDTNNKSGPGELRSPSARLTDDRCAIYTHLTPSQTICDKHHL